MNYNTNFSTALLLKFILLRINLILGDIYCSIVLNRSGSKQYVEQSSWPSQVWCLEESQNKEAGARALGFPRREKEKSSPGGHSLTLRNWDLSATATWRRREVDARHKVKNIIIGKQSFDCQVKFENVRRYLWCTVRFSNELHVNNVNIEGNSFRSLIVKYKTTAHITKFEAVMICCYSFS